MQNALDRVVLSRSLRLPPGAARLRARSQQRPRRHAPQPAPRSAHRRDAGRRSDGADACRRTVGRVQSIGDFGFAAARAVARAGFVVAVAARRGPHGCARRSHRGGAVCRRGRRVLARRGNRLLRAVHVRGRRDCRARARTQGHRRAVQQRRSGAPDLGRRTGGDGDRERPAVPPAAPQGRGTRPDARVQREHPRIARRWARGVRRRRADRPVEPGARGLLRRVPGERDWPHALPTYSTAVRRRASRRPPGESVRRDALPRAAGAGRSATTRHADASSSCWSTRRPFRCRVRPATRTCGRHDSAGRGHHRSRASRRTAADFREDGVDRPAGGRRRARGQHAAHRNLELHADAARRRRPARSEDRAAREDREADVPRREDRERSVELSRGPASGDASVRRWTSTPSSTDVFSLLEHQFEVGKHQGPARAVAGAVVVRGHRAPAPAGVPESVSQRARRHAAGRLAVGRRRGSTATRWWPRWPTPVRAFRPSSSRASTIRSSPRRRSAAARGSACRSSMASSANIRARFDATAPSVRAPGSR